MQQIVNEISQVVTKKKLLISISYISMGMLGMYITLYQYTILSVSQLFHINTAMMGLLIAMQHIGISIPPLFMGGLCYKIGKKKLMLIAFALLVAGTFTAGVADSLFVFIVSIFFIGAGFSVAEGTLSAVLTDEFPEESTKHLSFSQVAFSIGALCGPFIAAALIRNGVFFKDLYVYSAGLFLILGLIFVLTQHKNDKGIHAEKGNFKVRKFLGDRVILLLAFGILLYVGVENTVANFADSYFELALKAPEFSAVALALFWGAMIPSRFLMGIIKINTKKVFIFLSVLASMSAILAMIIPYNTIKIIMFALCGFSCGPLWPIMMDTVAKKNRGSTGPALNVMMSFCGFGGAILPLISGALVNFSSQQTAYYLSAATALLMLAVFLRSNGLRYKVYPTDNVSHLPGDSL